MEFKNISTNIVRDENRKLNYIVTPNAIDIFQTIFNNERNASKSFTIIGNYGTGKSSFLWAAEKNLKKEVLYFTNNVRNINGYNFIKLIGENKSISSSFQEILGLSSKKHRDIINSLEEKWLLCKADGKDLVIVIDEFGKFLEVINKNGKSEDLYLIQLIAEWANDLSKSITFIISLHQDFSEYGTNLSSIDKKEWEKVKGRFREVLFNEPIEQLIFFASRQLNSVQVPHQHVHRFEKLNTIINSTSLFPHSKDNFDQIANSLYPLDWLATNVLVFSLQRYGQNERSLFTFLNDIESNDLADSSIYSIEKVFDYLTQNLSSVIHSYKNPHRSNWHIAFRALDRAELSFDSENEYKIAAGLIKIICLLNIFSKPDSVLNDEILSKYYSLVSELDEATVLNVLENLYRAGIVRFYKHSKKINFLEGTDLDIEQELANMSKEINADFRVSDEIVKHIKFPIISAKKYSFKKGSPRYFEFKLLNDFNEINLPTGAIDGYVNVIFEELKEKEVISNSINKGPNLFVIHKNVKNIHDEIFTILRLERILAQRESDIVAKKLILKEINFHKSELERMILDDLFGHGNKNKWIFNGKRIEIQNKRALNNTISDICDNIYNAEPILINELINREFVSSQIASARKKLLRQLLYNNKEEFIGFEKDKFPPEKAIFISLFQETGIHKFDVAIDSFVLSKPQFDLQNNSQNSFEKLWNISENFFSSSISAKRNLQELHEILYNPPFKLKKGFLDIWVLSFLIINKESYALFHETNGFVPYLDEDILDLIHKSPKQFFVKSYKLDNYKIQLLESYKELLQLDEEGDGVNSTFLKIYGSFLRFYMSLNDYAKLTKNLSPQTMAFRDSINEARDPEEALFSTFPRALGFNPIDFLNDETKTAAFINQMQESIREIRVSYGNLLNRIEYNLLDYLQCECTNYNDYKIELVEKLGSIKIELLSKENAVFLRRLLSPFDHRDSWLKSVADIALNKPIDKIVDTEEALLMSNLASNCRKLFDIADIHSLSIGLNKSKSLISISILNPSGENAQKKIVIDELISPELQKTKDYISSEISNFDEKKRKQLLYELLLEEFETTEL